MKHGILIALGLALTAALFGCGVTAQPAPRSAATNAPVSNDARELSGSSAVNAFGFDLMRARLDESTASDNVVISPLSVHAALSMTLQGAKGQTAEEMQRTLHLPKGADAAAAAYTMLLDALGSRSKQQTLEVANAIWVHKDLAVKQEFLNRNRISFGSAVRTLDFGATDMAGVINQWVDEQTHGMIKQIVTEIDPRAVMVLANAIYFKASWADEFVREATQPEPFRLAGGKTNDVPTMHSTRTLPVVQTDTFSATKLGYSGGDSAAYLILPEKGRTLESVLSGLSAADFAELRTRLDSQTPTRTALAIPKFDATVATGLKKTLKNMGMPTAFDADAADFRAMATPPQGQNIWIGSVIHKARMKVDERGTEAAAATLVVPLMGAAAVSQPQQPPLPFICDHPFAIAVVDAPTGSLLFLAAINDPAER